MKRKILPLHESPIKVYSNYAYVLSVLLNNEDALNWFYSNFIQVKYIRDTNKNQPFIFNYSLGNLTKYFYNLPFLEVRSLARDFLLKVCDDIVGFLIKSLENNYYIMIIADEYYLPPRTSYNIQHYQHLIMLNGFDMEKKCFYSVGFNNGKYEEAIIDFGDMCKAVSSGQGNNKNVRDDLCMLYKIQDREKLEYPQEGYNYFPYKFNLKLVKRSLQEYLYSEYSDEHFDYFYEVSKNAEYGISYYEAMIEYVQKYIRRIYEGKVYEVAFHGMMEHKKVMVQRLEYMYEQGHVSNIDKEIEIYKALAVRAEMIRNQVLKFNLTGHLSILSSIAGGLNEMYIDEKKVVQMLINAI